MKLEWRFMPRWTADAKVELYRQDSAWRVLGSGSPDLNPLQAVLWQLGLSRAF